MKNKLEVYQAFLKITKIFDELGPEKTFSAFPALKDFIELQVGNNLSLLEVMYADIYSEVEKELEFENRLRLANNLPLKEVEDVLDNLKITPV